MELKDCFRLFTEEELVKGAELYYSGDLEKLTERKYSEETTSLYAGWVERGVNTSGREHDCHIRIHEGMSLICETECSCESFAEDHYGCPHVAGLLCAYMVLRKGEDVFRGTRLYERLASLTNTEDPFLPGVLKRTDLRLLSLLKGNEGGSLPVWKELQRNIDPLRIECDLTRGQGKMLLDLRAGNTRKALIVKDIRSFLMAYRSGELYAIGRNEYRLGRQYFEPASGDILEFLSGLMTAEEKGLYKKQLFMLSSGRAERYVVLSGPEFDSFMELADGMQVTLDEEQERMILLEKKGLGATLRKTAYGASLRITPAKLLYSGGNTLYMDDGEVIFRVNTEGTEKTQELLNLLKWNDELYIRESEIGSVCRNLLPVFREYGNVITKGMEFEDYERELPRFLFRLDYPEDRILSCIPYAIYERQGLKCLLYDETDAPHRNGAAESKVGDILPEIFQRLDETSGTLYSELDEDELFVFMRNALPRLEAMGTVMATDTLKRNKISRLPKVSIGIKADAGQLMLSLSATGLSPMEMSDILGAYKRKKKYYRLRSGEFLDLEEQQGNTWNTLAELYNDYGRKNPETIKLPAFRALYLQEMLEGREDAEFEAEKGYRKLIEAMDPSAEAKSPIPKTLRKTLRPYQAEGFRWIRMLKRCGFGGILADDMGLGKTLQCLSFLLAEKLEGRTGDQLRTLVVCPASLVYNWQKEIERYTPELTSVVIAGTAPARKELIEGERTEDIWITSYDLLKRDISLYENIRFANEIIDEAQFVKNQKTQAAQSVRVVSSGFRMALTGTPIENYLSELWSIMDYLMPGFLFQYGKFQNEYETPIVSGGDAGILERLRRMVHPFILRRLKKQVLKELPDKLEEVVSVRMENEQKKLYDASVEELRLMLDKTSPEEFRTGKLEFLSRLTRLRQICCDPMLLYENYSGGSAKLEACMELVEQAVSGGHKLLLFSQFTSMLDIIGERFREEDIAYHRIDGSVPKEKRMQMVDSFANDEVSVFLISLKAGGTGLNLTAADIVIHYDPWWNQAAQDQATDRTHRIGQTQRVMVYDLIAQDTVEERIQRIKEGKSKLVEDVLSGGEISSSAFDKEEMLELLR